MKSWNLTWKCGLCAAALVWASLAQANTLQDLRISDPTADLTQCGYVRAATGGMRGVGSGQLNLQGLPGDGTIVRALLYWHGYRKDSASLLINRTEQCLFGGTPIVGQAVGHSGPNGWSGLPFVYKYGQAFRADVSSLIVGNGSYTVQGFDFLGTNVQGASLVVFFRSPTLPDDQKGDYVVFEGNDSNSLVGSMDGAGWSLTIPSVTRQAGLPVWLDLHVSDAQYGYVEDSLKINGIALTPASGQTFPGVAPYDDPANFNSSDLAYMAAYNAFFRGLGFDIDYWKGSMWDARRFDISPYLIVGASSVSLTTGYVDEDMSLILAVVGMPSGGAPPPPDPNNHPPVIHSITAPTSYDCAPPTGLDATVTVRVSDPDGDALRVVWTVSGPVQHEDTLDVAAPNTVFALPFTHHYQLGPNVLNVTVIDGKGGIASRQTTVTITDYDITPAILDCGPEIRAVAPTAAHTVPVPNVLPQVTAVDNCPDKGLSTLAQSPAAGSVSYPPNVIPYPITVTATDPAGNVSSCQVMFLITTVVVDPPEPPAGNLAPVPADDSAATIENTPVTIPNVLANDTDPDNDPLSVTAYDGYGTQGGAAVYQGNGVFLYTPPHGFWGTDTFTYTVSDGRGGEARASVVVSVAQGNRPPVAVDDSASVVGAAPVVIAVLANDSDPENDMLTVVAVGVAANGVVAANADGTVAYTANLGFVGTDIFTYTISDGQGNTSTATVTVTVSNPPLPVVECAFTGSWWWPPNHEMVDVGLSLHTENLAGPVEVIVYSNQDDETPTGDGCFSPDASYDPATGKVLVRRERKGDRRCHQARVYLIVVRGQDALGRVALCMGSVGIPHDQSPAAIQELLDLGAYAQGYYSTHGAPPPGYFVVGDGPVIGPKGDDNACDHDSHLNWWPKHDRDRDGGHEGDCRDGRGDDRDDDSRYGVGSSSGKSKTPGSSSKGSKKGK